MNERRVCQLIVLLVGCSLTVMACGPAGEKEQPVDASSSKVQEVVERSLRSHSESVERALGFVAETSTYGDVSEGTDVRYRLCTHADFSKDRRGRGAVSCRKYEDPLEMPLREMAGDLMGYLEEWFFVEANVASVVDNVVTYRLDGPAVCGTDRSSACAGDVDASELEVEVTMTGEESLRAELRVGPDPHTPLTVRLSPKRWEIEFRLATIKETLAHVAEVTNTDLSLPARMKGELHLVGKAGEQGRTMLRWDVVRPLELDWEELGVRLGKSAPALRAQIDRSGAAAELEVGLAESAVSWMEDGELYRLSAVALGATTSLADGQKTADLEGLHVGGEPATLEVDGSTVSSFELDRREGRKFDASVSWTDRKFDISVSPTFDVALDMKFKRVADRLEDVADWARDSLTRLSIEGADPAKGLLVDGNGERGHFRMTQGKATFEVEGNTSIHYEVAGNQCLMATSTEGVEHPLGGYEVVSCPADQ